MKRAPFLLRVAALALVAVSALAARGQTVLYLTAGDSSSLQAVDVSAPNTILFSVTTSFHAYPIAVRNTVVLGLRENAGFTGEYDPTTGALIGTVQSPTGTAWDQALDGAASATQNFAISYSGNQVYSADSDWSNGALAFTASAGTGVSGITFDSASGTLWLDDSVNIYQYSTTGTLLSQFAHGSDRGGLAYQASTDTLWLVPNNNSLPLLQFDKTTGNVLQSLSVSGRTGNIWGAEFAAVPEPSTWALLAGGLGAVAWLRRRRR